MSKTKREIFNENMVVFYLSISVTTGKINLVPSDLQLPTDIDSAGVVKLGSKQVFSKDELKAFGTIKRRVTDYVSARGVAYQGGIAIPRNMADEVQQFIERKEVEFYEKKHFLLERYPEIKKAFVTEVKKKMPDMVEHIEPYILPREYLNSQIQFEFWTDAEEEDSFGNRVIDNIADQAKESLKSLKTNLVYKAATTVEHLTRIRDKLQGLSFATPYASVIVKRIDDFVETVPKKGCLPPDVVHDLMKELLFLADPSNWEILKESIKVETKPSEIIVSKPVKKVGNSFDFSDLNVDDFNPTKFACSGDDLDESSFNGLGANNFMHSVDNNKTSELRPVQWVDF